MNKLAHWFRSRNDCEHCKYFIDTTTCNENGTEYDGYCYIKGDDCCDDNCKWIFPFKQIVGGIRKKKHDYYRNHEYDDYGEFSEQEELRDAKMEGLIRQWIGDKAVCWKDEEGNYHEVEVSRYDGEMWRIRSEYEDFAHPFIHKTLKREWKELAAKTFNTLLNRVKPYFCK